MLSHAVPACPAAPAPDEVARVIALSDERDQWLERLLKAERAAYDAGYRAGRADRAREEDRRWATWPKISVAVIPSHAELEIARYARPRFADPRPEDRFRSKAGGTTPRTPRDQPPAGRVPESTHTVARRVTAPPEGAGGAAFDRKNSPRDAA